MPSKWRQSKPQDGITQIAIIIGIVAGIGLISVGLAAGRPGGAGQGRAVMHLISLVVFCGLLYTRQNWARLFLVAILYFLGGLTALIGVLTLLATLIDSGHREDSTVVGALVIVAMGGALTGIAGYLTQNAAILTFFGVSPTSIQPLEPSSLSQTPSPPESNSPKHAGSVLNDDAPA